MAPVILLGPEELGMDEPVDGPVGDDGPSGLQAGRQGTFCGDRTDGVRESTLWPQGVIALQLRTVPAAGLGLAGRRNLDGSPKPKPR